MRGRFHRHYERFYRFDRLTAGELRTGYSEGNFRTSIGEQIPRLGSARQYGAARNDGSGARSDGIGA
ncbi:MAG: hypothetical protein OXG11_10700 [Chloroflexi bacterium]|nr:hypothetical protein [Chloroflexota bacterium]